MVITKYSEKLKYTIIIPIIKDGCLLKLYVIYLMM